MAMMAKMRSLAPAFILTVGVLFVLFMVISDSNVMEALGGRTNNVGSINGQDITYPEFQAALDQQREARRQSGQEVDDEQIDQFRNQVWDFVVSQVLIDSLTLTVVWVSYIEIGPSPVRSHSRVTAPSAAILRRAVISGLLLSIS